MGCQCPKCRQSEKEWEQCVIWMTVAIVGAFGLIFGLIWVAGELSLQYGW